MSSLMKVNNDNCPRDSQNPTNAPFYAIVIEPACAPAMFLAVSLLVWAQLSFTQGMVYSVVLKVVIETSLMGVA